MFNNTTDNRFGFPLSHREEGQALVEYALILLLVALVTVGALTAIGTSVSAAINAMAAAL
jgi:pilus assembly protein Flp/PilA